MELNGVIRSVLSNNKNAFKEIVIEYSPIIRAYFSSKIFDKQAVDDLVQDTFIATYSTLQKVDLDIGIESWIKSIARNKLRSYFRSIKYKNNLFQQIQFEIMEELSEEIEEAECIDNDEIKKLRDCIEKLPDLNRKIVKSRYLFGRSVSQIALNLKSSVAAISARLYRSRLLLKECVNK